MRSLPLTAAAVLLLASACNAAPMAGDDGGDASGNFAGTATQSAAGSQNSAQRSGQPFSITPVGQFSQPWAMAFLPGSGLPTTNMALVTEKSGQLWLVNMASGQRQQVSGVPPVKAAGQGGLGDVVPAPDFAASRRVYLTYAEPGSGDTAGAALGHGTLEMGEGAPRLANFRVIWRQQPKVTGNGHYSHRIAFAPDGTIFLSSGDRQKMQPAQQFSGNLGKVLHLTAEGQPAGGNPWASRGGVAREFWTMGNRNILGLAFAPDGRLWATEMGPQGGDEINLIERGRNYGWPLVSDGSHYGGGPIPDHDTRPEFAAPKVGWTPVVSPAGMIVYTGHLFPQWRGDILFGALSGQALIRVDVEGANARKGEQWDMGARIREVEQGPGGEIYLLEDGGRGSRGRLLRLEPAR